MNALLRSLFKGNHSKSTTFVMPRNPRKRGKGKNDKKKKRNIKRADLHRDSN